MRQVNKLSLTNMIIVSIRSSTSLKETKEKTQYSEGVIFSKVRMLFAAFKVECRC